MVRHLIIASVLLAPATAVAENPHFTAAKKAWADYEIDRVLPLLDEALATSDDPTEKVEILEFEARIHITGDRNAAARATFVELLKLAPDYQLPSTSSPKIRAAFESAREALSKAVEPTSEPVQVNLRPVEPAPIDRPVWRTWWFWTIVGTAVAGGAALTVALVTSPPGPPETDLTFGPME